jgi:DNA polymerase III gamma/tau subunit
MTEREALHLKYRPRELGDIIGNRATVKSIESILDRDTEKRPHAYLFHGSSGCGKTTLARIMAERVGARGVDVKEINASSERGIDTIRAIKIGTQYKGLVGNARVWILDEVQGATRDAQNAMLKLLEDTPMHVYFFLCTTEMGKILSTIKNRCTQFEMRRLSGRQIESLLYNVIEWEAKDIEQEIVDHILRAANGCPRQALVMLDQLIDLDKTERKRAASKLRVEKEGEENLAKLLLSANKCKWKEVSGCLEKMTGEAEGIRRGIINYMSKVVLSSENPSPNAQLVFLHFQEPFYNNDRAGLVLACYNSWYDINGEG